MNKLFIGLLIIAAGAGAFFYLRKKNKSATGNGIKKEWILGQWKVDSLSASKDTSNENLLFMLYASDTNAKKDVIHFYDDGLLLITYPYDSLSKNDTAYFQWSKDNALLFKDKMTDSLSSTMLVKQPDSLHMVLQTKDSSLIYLQKEK